MSEVSQDPGTETLKERPPERLARSSTFAPSRLFGAALVGAFTGLAAYYFYTQMEPKARKRIRGRAVSLVKGQVRTWIDRGDDGEEGDEE